MSFSIETRADHISGLSPAASGRPAARHCVLHRATMQSPSRWWILVADVLAHSACPCQPAAAPPAVSSNVASSASRAASFSRHAFLCALQSSAWCSRQQYTTERQPEHPANSLTVVSVLEQEERAQSRSLCFAMSARCRTSNSSRTCAALASPVCSTLRARSTLLTASDRHLRSTAE